MVKRLAVVLFFTFVMASCGQPVPPPPPLTITDVWARDTVGSTANAAVFMTITSPTPDRLLAVSDSVADKTDLMTMQGGSSHMEMTYVGGIDIPAGKPVSLNPAGLHVWLAGLHQPLKAGQSFPLTLRFEKAGERTVTVSVIAPAAAAPMAGMKM